MKRPDDCRRALAAASEGDAIVLKRLLLRDPSLAEDPRLLNAAALHGRPDAARTLLAAGADPNGQVTSHERYRPLHRAIEHRGVARSDGHMEAVQVLLDAGASLELRATWMGLRPLAVAGLAGDKEFITLLRRKKAPFDIFHAAVTGDDEKVASFLKKHPPAASARDANNLTVLHYAALSGLSGEPAAQRFRKIAGLLLDAGADGDARESIGPYPPTSVLHFAAWKNFAVAETLLQRGCNPNFGFGNCLWKPPGPMAELFLAHGADVNGRESSGQPLLHSRIHWNLPGVALWLLKNGADPNATDKDGNTALHEAAARGINPKVAAAILERGGRRHARNNAGRTALDIARERRKSKIVALLED